MSTSCSRYGKRKTHSCGRPPSGCVGSDRANPHAIQRLAGHKDYRTTQIYVELSEQALIDEINRASDAGAVSRGRLSRWLGDRLWLKGRLSDELHLVAEQLWTPQVNTRPQNTLPQGSKSRDFH